MCLIDEHSSFFGNLFCLIIDISIFRITDVSRMYLRFANTFPIQFI